MNTNPNSSADLHLLGRIQLFVQIGQLGEDALSVPQHHVHHDSMPGVHLLSVFVGGVGGIPLLSRRRMPDILVRAADRRILVKLS